MGALDPHATPPVDLGKGVGWRFTARVVEWLDGDSVVVDCLVDVGFEEMVTKRRRIRLAGIDCPETRSSDPAERVLGAAAAAFSEQLAPVGAPIWVLVIRPDKYGGRDLGDVAAGDGYDDIAHALLEHGHAVPYNGGRRS